ncbi:MAG: NAD-dependent epimerase/dehydratase family protein [Bacteroidetes bacterium]|nr:MAG: NAD-dependent epimerase/dehydratase family protein [Bacteroidota bacterium]
MKKNILILGGFGFIGSNLIEDFLKNGNFNVIVFEFRGLINRFANQIKVYYGDFNKEEDIEIVFQENQIDIVIHLISTTVPATSNDNVSYDINSNLIGTIKLLNIMLKYGVKRIIFPSSGGTVYGQIAGDSAKENDPTNPISSHGITKLSIEKYLLLYQHLHGLEYLILRVSNPFGMYHSSQKQGFINVVLKKIIKNEKIVVWGDGSAVRDYMYIKDLTFILTKIIENDIKNQIINIGSGVGVSIKEILNLLQNIVPNIEIVYESARNFDIPKIVLNVDKLKSMLDFSLTDLEKAIFLTYNWHKKKE